MAELVLAANAAAVKPQVEKAKSLAEAQVFLLVLHAHQKYHQHQSVLQATFELRPQEPLPYPTSIRFRPAEGHLLSFVFDQVRMAILAPPNPDVRPSHLPRVSGSPQWDFQDHPEPPFLCPPADLA